MKKVLSLVLVIAMVLSSMSFAFASTFEDVTGDYEDAINTLAGLGVVTGYEDGTYRPEKVVTRAEMAKLMVEILGYGDLVAGAKSNFADTQGHWADAYIALAAGRNIVVGDGNGNFRPDATVTYNEVLTMIVRGLGYTDDSNELKTMTWPTNFKVKAAELGITDAVVMNSTGADRGGVAQALYNALDALLVSVDVDGNVVYLKGNGNNGVKLLTRLAQEVGTYNSGEERYELTVTTDMLNPDHARYAGNLVDMEQYLYEKVEAYAAKNDKDLIVYVGESYTDTEAGTFKANNPSGVTTDNNKVNIKLADESTETYNVTGSVVVYFNGEQVTGGMTESNMEDGIASTLTSLVDAKAKFVYDDNDYVTHIVATKATYGDLIGKEYRTDALKLDAINLPQKDGKVNLAKVTVEGAVDNINDIEEDDVVIAYAAKGAGSSVVPSKVKLVVAREAVEGTVTRTSDDAKTIYVDGVKYSKSSVDGAIPADYVTVNDEGTFYLDNAGKIFAVDVTSELENYGIIVATPANGSTKTSFNVVAVDDAAQIKIATAEDERVIFDVLTTFDNNQIDEVAKIVTSTGAVVAPVVTTSGSVLQVNNTLTAGSLVKYSVDSDGKLDKIYLVPTPLATETIDKDDLDLMTTENTIVFDATTTKYEVVALSSLKDNATHSVVYYNSGADKGKIAVIVSTNIKSVNDGKYGVVSALNYTQNKDGDRVVEVTALVDGKEVVYLTGKGATVGQFAYTTTSAAYRFTFNNNDVLTGVVGITPGTAPDTKVGATLSATIADVSETGMKVNNIQKYFASDVAIYIYDQSADEIRIADYTELLETGDTNYVSTSVYVLDTTESSRLDVVVQVVK
jgi:hypothetical protein